MTKIKLNKSGPLTILTTTGGTGSVACNDFTGRVKEIVYDGGLATGADITITRTSDGLVLLVVTDAGTSAAGYRPLASIVDAANAAITGGDYWNIVNDSITITVAQGGSEDTGIFRVYWEE
jgi:hypothetical protein